jgi:pimeloyl-ACP methyl ester carboxylesterase
VTGIATYAVRSASSVRALTLLAVVLDPPVVSQVARALTREPRVDQTEAAGVPVEVVRPGGDGPWPAWLFVNGAHPLRRTEPVVTRLSRGLARAGYLALVPDIPGLGEGKITESTLDATFTVIETAVARPDVRDGRMALIGASTGASLALLAAARPELATRISVVAAVAPFADLERMICLATTRCYLEHGRFARYEVTPLHRQVVARSLVAAVPVADDREPLVALLDSADREEGDLIDAVRGAPGREPETRAILEVLKNEDPNRFAELCAALPSQVRTLLDRFSPLAACARVVAPVEVVVPPSDVYFPPGEARALVDALPNARLTITETLDHTRPQLSLARLGEFRKFGAFVARGLAAAGVRG